MASADERKGTVLVMDDDDMIRLSTGQLLEALGYQVFYAEDGSVALDILKKNLQTDEQIDIMIMDLTIPNGMGGVECISLVREISSEVKVVVSTGDPVHEVFINHKQFGFDYALAKPFTLDIFQQMLASVSR